jgi:DNA mismatch endonuclease, patch repair protein
MDSFTKNERSAIMRRVKGKNTGPEMRVRKLVFGLGYRYRLHRADLPGKPDLVFAGRRKVIFVHGCFWHGHDCRAGKNRPSSNKPYWTKKLEGNMTRDRKNVRELERLGFESLVIWECELKDEAALTGKIVNFLDGPRTG